MGPWWHPWPCQSSGSHGSVFDILLLKGLRDLISGDGHSPPQTIGTGQIKMAKHNSGLLASVGLQVPAVKTDNLIVDYNKMGVIFHIFMLRVAPGQWK